MTNFLALFSTTTTRRCSTLQDFSSQLIPVHRPYHSPFRTVSRAHVNTRPGAALGHDPPSSRPRRVPGRAARVRNGLDAAEGGD